MTTRPPLPPFTRENGRQEIVAFLTRKWTKELDYRLIKESFGPSAEIALPCASHMSGTMTPGIGIGRTETRTGNSTTTD
jgi:hypothetical protein